jgi:hypothetical protein
VLKHGPRARAHAHRTSGAPPERAGRQGPDAWACRLVGVLTLGMAVSAVAGQMPDLPGFDPRWLLAGGAALIGLLLLVGSLRGRRST